MKAGYFIFLAAILASLVSCDMISSSRAMLWTDRPEFAFYAEHFNAAQNKFKIEVRYFESPARRLTEPGEPPDIVAASWLNSAPTRALFRPLDKIIAKDDMAYFYPQLLSLGNFDKRQYLLPVSFNIPAMVFAEDLNHSPSNHFTIEMEEIKERAKAYNAMAGGEYTRMGFSLSSNDDFLFLAAALFGTAFREASPIAWESQSLERSIAWVRNWIAEANTSVQQEDDFAYKYFYDPPEKLINSGRILYAYMDSSHFFTLPEEHRANLDFRWIAAGEMIPLDEGCVYYGIHRRTRARKAAEAFTIWFFKAETQKLLLEAGKSKRLHETSFGIAGGFSAMRTVTERIFPQFYPSLIGHIPSESSLSPANILPRNWLSIKERVILPFLRERVRHENREDVRPLERRIADWNRLNRE